MNANSYTQQALVLVGGRGTRLGSLAFSTPKPLLAIDSETVFLDELLFNIARYGFRDIVLLGGHFGHQFVERYSGKTYRGANVRVLLEAEPAGTAGALVNARDILSPTFLLTNGDTLFDINLRDIETALRDDAATLAALALRRVPDASRFGSVGLEGRRILSFREKRLCPGDDDGGLINGGIGAFRREILSFIESTPSSLEFDVFPRVAAAGKLAGKEFSGYFIDIGVPETLALARQELPHRRRKPTLLIELGGVIDAKDRHPILPDEVQWVPGALETIRRTNDIGALVIIIGDHSEGASNAFHAAMAAGLARVGAHVDAFYSRLDRDIHSSHLDSPNLSNPGSNVARVLKAVDEWPIDPSRSVFVCGRSTDIAAVQGIGIRGMLLQKRGIRAIADAALDHMTASANMNDVN